MTKLELINEVIELAGGDKRQTTEAVELVFATIKQTLCRDDRVEIRGFGSFANRAYKAYEGRNPKTGNPATVPPKRTPFFKTAKQLKIAIDNKSSN